MENKLLKKKTWRFLLLSCILFSTFLIIVSVIVFYNSQTITFLKLQTETPKSVFVESKLKVTATSKNTIPRLAYLISGSKGDGESIKRTLWALFHPRNQYVVHLDLEASAEERLELVKFVRTQPLFLKLSNVRVVVKSNLITYRGPTMVTNTLHAAAILLKEGGDWDWFINLSAADYPLVTQDDLLYTLSGIPRHLNFLEHTSDIGWKEDQRAMPVIIDSGLYSFKKEDVFWVSEKRKLPSAFKLFTGSAWMMLSRPFMEYCIWGWDNLPRIILMYYANFLSSPEGYFHTVICNVDEFRNTTINHDLHFISWDTPPQQHPHFLTQNDYATMVASNAPFARKFLRNQTLVLDRIDSELLGRSGDAFVPGAWFDHEGNSDALANVTALRPGSGARRIKRLIQNLLAEKKNNQMQCT